jgi:hypothetical protein
MLFTTLLQRLTRTRERHEESRPRRQLPCRRRAARPRGFVPELTTLEDRSLPSVAHRPFHHLLLRHTPALTAAHQHSAFNATRTVSFHRADGKGNEDTQVVPFAIDGGGPAPDGIPLFPGGTAPHSATGEATHLGKYTGNGLFTLDGFTSATTGTFHGTFVFVAANGDRLATRYGAVSPGQFTIMPTADGKVVVQFVAVFTPVPGQSTGRFARVTGGGFLMIATTEPFDPTPNAQGYTMPFHYTWHGVGDLEFAHGNA